jgi:hypothetical protein
LAGVLGLGLTMHTRRLARLMPPLAIRTHRSGAESCLDSAYPVQCHCPARQSVRHQVQTIRLFVAHSLACYSDIPTHVWALSQTQGLFPKKEL